MKNYVKWTKISTNKNYIVSTNGYHNGLTDILDYKMDLLMELTEGKQFHLFLALQHTTAGLLQYGGGSYQSGLGGRLSKSVGWDDCGAIDEYTTY